MSGTDSAAGRAWSEIRATNWSSVAPVAASDFATDSVEGQRARPSGVMRFDLLNVVGSRPARLASPDAESFDRAASRSMAIQICPCVNMVGLPKGNRQIHRAGVGEASPVDRNYNLRATASSAMFRDNHFVWGWVGLSFTPFRPPRV